MAIAARDNLGNRNRVRWRGLARVLASVTVLLLLGFSPSVAWFVSQRYARLHATPAAQVLPENGARELPALPAPSLQDVRSYASTRAAYEAALDALKVSRGRRVRLLEGHFTLQREAADLLGTSQAAALMRLLRTETLNQAAGRRSVFSSPEAALASAETWLAFLHFALRETDHRDLRGLAATLRAHSPVPMAPQAVFRNAKWIRRAAAKTHLPPAALAAVVDTEQAGGSLAYGLSGALRAFTDNAALRATELYGRSGMTGELSRTVGLAQMSWEDALGQERRLRALGVGLGVPFPQNEAEAREVLSRPYANLLLTASRMVGYLNRAEGLGPNSVVPHEGAWVYFLAPGWHNNPRLAQGGETWPYAWNAFFKACLYQRLLP